MFALLAHITMEEEPLLAIFGGLSAVCGALGVVIGSYFGRRVKVKSED